MDQGFVALVTAVVGLVGAVGGAAVGGIASARGARIGAETTALATAKQVRDQAAIDHEHWLRGQRLEACGELLAAYGAYTVAASNVARAIEGEMDGTGEMGKALGDSVAKVRNSQLQVRLLGPEDVRQPALELRRHVEDHDQCVMSWLDTSLDMDGSAWAAAYDQEAKLRGQFGVLHDAFMEAASRSVCHGPVADRAGEASN